MTREKKKNLIRNKAFNRLKRSLEPNPLKTNNNEADDNYCYYRCGRILFNFNGVRRVLTRNRDPTGFRLFRNYN